MATNSGKVWAYGTGTAKAVRRKIKLRKLMYDGILKPLTKDEMRKLVATATLKKHQDGST